jgi:alpha-beta hydrolase superfamily lysophospholipase
MAASARARCHAVRHSGVGLYFATPSGFVGVRGCTHDLRRNLHHITAPTLIMDAREDDTESLRSADLVEGTIASSVTRNIILEDSYHIITMDNDRDTVVQESLRFVSRVRAADVRLVASSSAAAL